MSTLNKEQKKFTVIALSIVLTTVAVIIGLISYSPKYEAIPKNGIVIGKEHTQTGQYHNINEYYLICKSETDINKVKVTFEIFYSYEENDVIEYCVYEEKEQWKE